MFKLPTYGLDYELNLLLIKTLNEMGTSVRAKFKCTQKSEDSFAHSVILTPVVGGSPENDAFYKATPGGDIKLTTVSKSASDSFEVGKEYYVDFAEAHAI